MNTVQYSLVQCFVVLCYKINVIFCILVFYCSLHLPCITASHTTYNERCHSVINIIQILLIQVYSVMMNVHVELKFVGQLILKLKCLQNCLRKPQDFYNENKCLHGMYRGLSQECFISIHYLIC